MVSWCGKHGVFSLQTQPCPTCNPTLQYNWYRVALYYGRQDHTKVGDRTQVHVSDGGSD